MKKANVVRLLTLAALAIVMASCGGVKKMAKNANLVDYKVEPAVLEMHGDEVAVNITGSFPEKYFSKKAVVTITPVLKYDGGEKAYKPMVFQGEGVEANNQAIAFEAGGNIDYKASIPYSDDMKVSELVLKISAAQGSKSIDFDEVKVADGVIATPRLLQADPKAYAGSTKEVNVTPSVYDAESSVYQRVVPDALTADIHYSIQQSGLRNSELRSDDIKMMKEFLKTIKENEKVELNNIEIASYASPDGALELNEKLSGRRGTTAENYIKKELKRKKITDAEVLANVTAEDWAGFKELVQNSDIADKRIILSVLSKYSDVAVREEQIKNLSETFKKLKEEVLPALRRSKYNVNVNLIGKSDEEIMAVAASNPDSLNKAELLYAASLTEDLDKKLSLYKSFSANFKNDWRGPNNEGVIYLEKSELENAKTAFNKAKGLDDNAFVLNNLGTVELLSNNFAGAEEYFSAALSAGKKASYNLGLVMVKKGMYGDAVAKMGECTSFNAALAKSLSGDNNGALKLLEDKENKDAMDYYLKAVVGARTSNDELVFSSLKNAITKDATLAGKAKSDLEFFKYFEMGAFQTIVK